MNNAIVREQYIALREAWQNKDFGLALKRAFSLLNDQPDHASALKIRLRAALKIPDAAGVAQFAPPVAAFDLSLALLAASKLAAWRDDVAAAEVYVSALASNQLPSAPAKIQASVNSQSRARGVTRRWEQATFPRHFASGKPASVCRPVIRPCASVSKAFGTRWSQPRGRSRRLNRMLPLLRGNASWRLTRCTRRP